MGEIAKRSPTRAERGHMWKVNQDDRVNKPVILATACRFCGRNERIMAREDGMKTNFPLSRTMFLLLASARKNAAKEQIYHWEIEMSNVFARWLYVP